MDASDLLIANPVLDGFNCSVTEDANCNGSLDQGEVSILVRIENAGS